MPHLPRHLPRPDLTDRPHDITVERAMSASPDLLYQAWTRHFDVWFATPGTVAMRGQVGEPFYFETQHEGQRHPHYGRFLALEPARLVELTWLTGAAGTNGAETVVRVELMPDGGGTGTGTTLRLTHSGFADEVSAKQHAEAWPRVLAQLDEQIIRYNAGEQPA